MSAAIRVLSRRTLTGPTAIELRSSAAMGRGRLRRTSSFIGFLISTELCNNLFKKLHPFRASG